MRASSFSEPRLRVLVVGPSVPLETFVADRLEALADRGFGVTVAAVVEAEQHYDGIRILRQPRPDEPLARTVCGLLAAAVRVGLRSPSSLLGAMRAARGPLRERHGRRPVAIARRLRAYLPLATLRPDLVHFEWNSAAIEYGPLARVWRCPTLVSCHGSEVNVRPRLPGGERFARSLRASFASVGAVHCVSRSVASQAFAHGADPSRTRLIAPGVDLARFRPARFRPAQCEPQGEPRPGEPLRAVKIAALRSIKGHAYAVGAIRRLADWDVPATLELIGGDPRPSLAERSERARIEEAIDRLAVRDRVRLLGALAPGDVARRLRHADVLLHTSVSEGLCVAVLEAMACAVPVVVAAYPGVEEAVADGVHGFVVPLRSPEAAAAALRRLHEDRELARRMGAAGRAHVVSRFGLEREADLFAGLYRSVAERRLERLEPAAIAPHSIPS